MKDQNDSNKGFLKDKLGDYQQTPPESVWESISDQLGGGRSRRSMLFLVLAAAASLALAVTLGIHYFGPDLPQESGLAEEAAQEEIVPESISPLEERVLKTLETLVTEGSEDAGKTKEARLTVATENPDGTEENAPDETGLQQRADKEITTDKEILLDREVVPDEEEQSSQETVSDQLKPEDPIPVEALSLEGDDQVPIEALTDFMDDKKKKSRWMVGAVISPLYSFRDAEASVMAGAGVHESGLLSYSSGVHVNYRRRSRLSFETGIFFNKTGLAINASGIESYNQQSDYLLFGAGSEQADIKAVTNSVGNIISNSGEIFVNGYKLNAQNAPEAAIAINLDRLESPTSGIEQHLDYLELPFNLRYTVVDRTFELQLVGGVSTNFLVNNYVTMQTSAGTEEIGYLSNIRNVNYSGNAGLGMIYHVGKKLNLMLEPRFRYFLNSINDSSLPSTRPYSIGLYTSLNFTF